MRAVRVMEHHLTHKHNLKTKSYTANSLFLGSRSNRSLYIYYFLRVITAANMRWRDEVALKLIELPLLDNSVFSYYYVGTTIISKSSDQRRCRGLNTLTANSIGQLTPFQGSFKTAGHLRRRPNSQSFEMRNTHLNALPQI